MKRDASGRRLWRIPENAFKAQKSAVINHGVFTGVVRHGEFWTLLHDPEAE